VTSRLASLLVQEGLVSAKKMAQAFQRQVIYGGTLDTILLEMDAVEEPTLVEAMGRASGLPTAGDLPSKEQLDAAGASGWFPLATCEKFRAVPVSVDGNVIRVLVLDPPDRKQLDELGYTLQRSIDPIVVPEVRFVHAVELVYGVVTPARFASLQAKLAKRAAEAPSREPKSAPQLPVFTVAPRDTKAKLRLDTPAQPAKIVQLEAEPGPPVRDTLETPIVDIGDFGRQHHDTLETPVITFDHALKNVDGGNVSVGGEQPAPEPSEPADVERSGYQRRAVLTDVPIPGKAVPQTEASEMPTPRATPREAGSPKSVPQEVTVQRGAGGPTGDASPLDLDAAAKALEAAQDRDAIFVALCRGARSQLQFVALFLVHGETSVGRLALAEDWLTRETLAAISVPVARSSAFSGAVNGRSPYVGRIGEDAPTLQALAALGRKPPLPGLILPIVLRERTVALLYGDLGGEAVDATRMGGLSALVAGAGRAFQRLILRQKSGEYQTSPTGSQPSSKLSAAMAAVVSARETSEWKRPTAAPIENDKKFTQRGFAALAAETMQQIHDMPTAAKPAGPAMTDAEALVMSVIRQDEHASQSAEALVLLGERGAQAVVAHLPGPLRLDRHALRGPAPPLPEHGPLLAVLARLKVDALKPLLGRLNDPSLEVRYYCTLACGALGVPVLVPALGARLLDADAGVRHAAVTGLAHFGESDELRTLTESLRGELPGPEPIRQRYAAEALGALRDVPSVPRLIELVKHPDPQVVAAARRALIEITKQDFGTSRWRWRGWWDRHRDQSRIEWMLEGLGHTESEVRSSAAEELRTLGEQSFGYQADLPKREREEARRKWIDWWRERDKSGKPLVRNGR
jgi:hypothetical protein